MTAKTSGNQRFVRSSVPLVLLLFLPLSVLAQGEEACTGFTSLGPPSWSRSSNLIAFTDDCGGAYGIYVFDLESGALQKLNTGDIKAEGVSWSHSGKEIAFSAAMENEHKDIFILEVSSEKITRLTRDGSQWRHYVLVAR